MNKKNLKNILITTGLILSISNLTAGAMQKNSNNNYCYPNNQNNYIINNNDNQLINYKNNINNNNNSFDSNTSMNNINNYNFNNLLDSNSMNIHINNNSFNNQNNFNNNMNDIVNNNKQSNYINNNSNNVNQNNIINNQLSAEEKMEKLNDLIKKYKDNNHEISTSNMIYASDKKSSKKTTYKEFIGQLLLSDKEDRPLIHEKKENLIKELEKNNTAKIKEMSKQILTTILCTHYNRQLINLEESESKILQKQQTSNFLNLFEKILLENYMIRVNKNMFNKNEKILIYFPDERHIKNYINTLKINDMNSFYFLGDYNKKEGEKNYHNIYSLCSEFVNYMQYILDNYYSN